MNSIAPRKISVARRKLKPPSMPSVNDHPIMMALRQIQPAPENDTLYAPIDKGSQEIRSLAKSILTYGLKEPIQVSSDFYIISGHRRYAAAQVAGLKSIKVIIDHSISRAKHPDRFVVLLREHNRQRVKSFDEQVREEALSINPAEAHRVVVEQRKQKSAMGDFAQMTLGSTKTRKRISGAKQPMLDKILKVLDELKESWPVSDRRLHYKLLNDPPLKHASKPDSVYVNNLASYKSLTDLLTRARIAGLIPWRAISDDTRVSEGWNFDRQASTFLAREMDGFCKAYYRDLQQSQPNHIEIFCEKFTLESTVRPIASEYCIPLTIGKGMCSSPPRFKMMQRFLKTGKQKLVVLLISDFDPDGVVIAESFARSMRDDFGIDEIVAVRVALTQEQVHQYQLPNAIEAKSSSRNFQKFVDQFGTDCHELDALDEGVLQSILRQSIESVLDREAFNHEIEQEGIEVAKLEAFRRAASKMLSGVQL